MEPSFEIGERVLSFHRALLYEAKVKDKQITTNDATKTLYKIHYMGWSKNWDELKSADQILKFNRENLIRQRKLISCLKNLKENSAKKSRQENDSSNESTPTPEDAELRAQDEWKSRRGSKIEPPGPLLDCPLTFPPALIQDLVSNHTCITQKNQLLKLPRNPTVTQILDLYYQNQLAAESDETNIFNLQVVSGLKVYFHISLNTMLLYQQELHQFSEVTMVDPDKSVCDIYGFEHLLRLLVKLPQIVQLGSVTVAQKFRGHIQLCLDEVVEFLHRNRAICGQAVYYDSSPVYQRFVSSGLT